MKPLIFSIVFLVLILVKPEPIVIKLDNKPELFTVDKLGNFYVYHNYQLSKYTTKGELVAQFSRLESGKLEFIDASDPMHLLLFYKEFNQLIFLDNHLNQKGKPVYLDELELNSVSAVCKSKQMAVWIYDEYENKLIHFGFNPRKVIQTINLDNLNNELSDINFMLEHGNELYMNQKNKAVWIFDQFGGRLNKLNIQIEQSFQVINQALLYNNGVRLYSINLKNEKISSLKIKDFNKFDDVRISNNQIYIVNNKSITIKAKPENKDGK